MAISENQLEIWAHQGSVTQSADTYEAIKSVLEDPRASYNRQRRVSVFLQGSYGNSTNIRADSDVDIVICLSSVFYGETKNLNEEEQARHKANFIPGEYSFDEFKSEVTDWLQAKFDSVTAGKKAISVPGRNGRRDADVLACVEHRDHFSYPAQGSPRFHQGICFWTSDGDEIVNYPEQHKSNCTSKHGGTSNRFKPNIRVIKNMRNAMIDDGFIQDGVAPSYFLEGMLYNVPNGCFSSTHRQSFEDALAWLERCNIPNLRCANERYDLVRDGSHVCWNTKDFQATLTALRRYWNSSHR